MSNFGRVCMYAFFINVLAGFVAVGYLLSQFIGYWAILVTGMLYVPLVILGVKPAMRETK